MKIKFSFICAAIICMLGIVSCTKEPLDQPETKIIKETIDEGDLDFLSEVFWLGPDYEDKEVFIDRAEMAPDIESASIVVLTGTALEANKDIVDEAYRNSKVIILCDPDFGVYNRIAETMGWPITSNDDEKSELFAFSLAGTSNLLTPKEPIVIDDPEILPDSDSDLPLPELVPNEEGVIEEYEAPDYEEIIKLKYLIDPFVERVNALFVDLDCATKSFESDDDHDVYGTVKRTGLHSVVFNYSLRLRFAQTAASLNDYLHGIYQSVVRWEYLPAYSFGNQNTVGDYYIMKLSYESHPEKAWYGDDLVRTHGAVDVHYTGAFLRTLDVKTYIETSQSGKKTLPTFVPGYTPLPESTVNCTSYSKSRGWNIGGGVSIGAEGNSEAAKGKGELSFSWGYSNNETVSFSLPDMQVENHSFSDANGEGAGWTMLCQNLPRKSGVRNITTCPSIAKSNAILRTNWIWHIDKYDEGSKESVGDMVIEVHPTLGIARNGFWFKFVNYSYDLMPLRFSIPLKAPNRVSFATLSFRNTIPNVVIKNLVVTDVTDQKNKKVVYESSGDLLQYNPDEKNALEINLALRKYTITFKGTNSRTGVTNTYVLKDGFYTISKARSGENDVIIMDAATNFKISGSQN